MNTPAAGPELTVLYRIPSGSNAVYRCEDAEGGHWVYKPSAGERPLADFPEGTLAAREVAAYAVSSFLGWDLVPETITAFGPGGKGMAQRWVEERDRSGEDGAPDPVDVHAVNAIPGDRVAVLRGEGAQGEDVVVAHATDARLRRIALFDLVINNADRKGGHVLVDTGGRSWGIDHGLSFHTDPKLRTVLWGWAGQPLPEADVPGLAAVRDGLTQGSHLRETLSGLLHPDEIDAIGSRVAALLGERVFPSPGPGYPLPWPLF